MERISKRVKSLTGTLGSHELTMYHYAKFTYLLYFSFNSFNAEFIFLFIYTCVCIGYIINDIHRCLNHQIGYLQSICRHEILQ